LAQQRESFGLTPIIEKELMKGKEGERGPEVGASSRCLPFPLHLAALSIRFESISRNYP